MTNQQKMSIESEEFVRRVLTKTFGQKPSNAQVRKVAQKVLSTLPRPKEERAAA